MKKLSKFIDIILYCIVGIVLTAAITSAIFNKPMLLSSVRSNSMYPLFQRSDMILINNLSNNETVSIGDIVLFKVQKGSLSSEGWIVHRIVDGNEETGYITKGDANEYTDQSSGGTGSIKREWIASKVVTLGNHPLKIPLVGYLPLWMESFQNSPYAMPIIAVILAGLIGISELSRGKKRKRKHRFNNDLSYPILYFLAGLTITIIMGASMLATSQRIVVPYEVSKNQSSVIMGSTVGMIQVGDELEQPLSDLNNKGFIPIVATITSKDNQIDFNQTFTTLRPGNALETTMHLKASTPGKYNSTINVGMFYPFLPSKIIYTLSLKSYWLALILVSIIPGLPLMAYPLIDSTMRRKIIKKIRRLIRRISSKIPIIN